MFKQENILLEYKNFLTDERGYQEGTVRNNYFFILNFLKKYPIPFTLSNVGKYLREMEDTGKSRYYINSCLCYLRTFFDFCTTKKIDQENFSFDLKRLRRRVGNEIDPHKFLTADQVIILINFSDNKDYSKYQYPNLAKKMDKRFKMFIYFVYFTGCRGNEAACLRKKDISFDSHEVVFYKSKNGTDRIAELSETIETMLKKYVCDLKDNDWVFQGHVHPERHVNPKKMSRKLKLLGLQLLGKRVTMHMLRHTFGSLSHQHGMPLLFIKEQLGHKRIESTMRYMHADRRELRKSMQNCNPLEMCNQTNESLLGKYKDFVKNLHLDESPLPYEIVESNKRYGLIIPK